MRIGQIDPDIRQRLWPGKQLQPDELEIVAVGIDSHRGAGQSARGPAAAQVAANPEGKLLVHYRARNDNGRLPRLIIARN